jgi:serpin B
LSIALKSMGLSLIFTTEADFSGITGQKDIYLNKAIHKAVIQVDETGTAIAPIAQNLPAAVGSEPPYEFKANHPFLFIVWERQTGSILLMGRLSLP